jgi:hypothetical protein
LLERCVDGFLLIFPGALVGSLFFFFLAQKVGIDNLPELTDVQFSLEVVYQGDLCSVYL